MPNMTRANHSSKSQLYGFLSDKSCDWCESCLDKEKKEGRYIILCFRTFIQSSSLWKSRLWPWMEKKSSMFDFYKSELWTISTFWQPFNTAWLQELWAWNIGHSFCQAPPPEARSVGVGPRLDCASFPIKWTTFVPQQPFFHTNMTRQQQRNRKLVKFCSTVQCFETASLFPGVYTGKVETVWARWRPGPLCPCA